MSSENETTDNNNDNNNDDMPNYNIIMLDDSRLNTPYTTRPHTTNTQTKSRNTHSKTKKTEEPTAREIQGMYNISCLYITYSMISIYTYIVVSINYLHLILYTLYIVINR